MKTTISILFLIASVLPCFAQLKVCKNGNVLIGQTNKGGVSKLTVGGTVTTDGIMIPFTPEMKESTTPIEDGSEKILTSVAAMEVMTYSMPPSNNKDIDSPQAMKHFALSPDALQLLYPAMVKPDADGNMNVNYTELVPVLVRCIQELQQEVEALKGTVSALASFSNREELSRSTESRRFDNSLCVSASLSQNQPNPVKAQTIINYRLNGDFNHASIRICDVGGSVLKSYEIQSGSGSVMVNTSDMRSGLFLYSLIFDGNTVDTKKMIVSK